MEKLCVFCKHCEFDYYSGGGGCETCGYGGEGAAYMKCNKGHWSVEMSGYSGEPMKDYRETILTAQTCPDFKIVKLTNTGMEPTGEAAAE